MSELIVPAQAHGRKHNSGIAPHPVLLPMGEATVLHAPSDVKASPLPGGEGQGEGSNRRYAGAAAKLSPAIHGNGNVGTIR
jgi:hypothetical protein